MFTPNILIAWSRLVNTDIFLPCTPLRHSIPGTIRFCSLWLLQFLFSFHRCFSSVFLINAFQSLECFVLFFPFLSLYLFISKLLYFWNCFQFRFCSIHKVWRRRWRWRRQQRPWSFCHRSKHSMFNKSNKKKLFNYKNDNGKRKERKTAIGWTNGAAVFFLLFLSSSTSFNALNRSNLSSLTVNNAHSNDVSPGRMGNKLVCVFFLCRNFSVSIYNKLHIFSIWHGH